MKKEKWKEQYANGEHEMIKNKKKCTEDKQKAMKLIITNCSWDILFHNLTRINDEE